MSPKPRLNPLLRGYLLLFDRREPPDYSSATGFGLLIVFFMLEYVIGPRTHILNWFGVVQPPAWARVSALITIAILATFLTRAPRSAIGLLPLPKWTNVEVLYLLQVIVFGSAIFAAVNLPALRTQTAVGMELVGIAIATAVIWGFYQELIYRGILQTELARRFGAVAGVVVANAAFAFGPLHFYELSGPSPLQSKAIFFAVTFAIGMVFGYITLRTRNVVLVGIMHGVGDAITSAPHALH